MLDKCVDNADVAPHYRVMQRGAALGVLGRCISPLHVVRVNECPLSLPVPPRKGNKCAELATHRLQQLRDRGHLSPHCRFVQLRHLQVQRLAQRLLQHRSATWAWQDGVESLPLLGRRFDALSAVSMRACPASQ